MPAAFECHSASPSFKDTAFLKLKFKANLNMVNDFEFKSGDAVNSPENIVINLVAFNSSKFDFIFNWRSEFECLDD